jgi:N-sulfoglucosamine sulfohydrolase
MTKGLNMHTILLLFCITFLGVLKVYPSERPNILWVNSEDNGAQWLSCYGSPNARTPNLDQLAVEGFRYTHCYANSAVCAPTRTTWITGVHAISMGTQPMRSRYDIPHKLIPYWPDLLPGIGYVASNFGGKNDFNIGSRPDGDTWKIAKGATQWDRLKEQQPFVAFKTLGTSHESAPMPVKKRGFTDEDADKMVLHPYHPDLPPVRSTYAKYAQAMYKMDREFGELLAELKAHGLRDSTIVIYSSDHGGILPRSKRFLYTSGTHCPLIVYIPEKWKHLWPAERPGTTVDRLVSFIDMPKTVLSLTGAEIPPSMQGTIFLGEHTEPEPAYHFSYRGRADKTVDMVRVMRTKQYIYMKNYMPWAPHGQFLSYMWGLEATPAWHQHFKAGKCTPVQARFFQPRQVEEFYDEVDDYHNIKNLIDSPEHQETIALLRKELRRQQLATFDSGLLPEQMRLARAEKHNLTIYEMVRRPDLYPLEQYLDYTDMILEQNPDNLARLIEDTASRDEATRFWALCGLAYLGKDAQPAAAAIEKATQDEFIEVQIMAHYAQAKTQGTTKEVIKKFKEMLAQAPQVGDSGYSSFVRSLSNLLNGN